MKICHLTSVHKYNDTRITLKECSSLVNENYQVSLIAPNTEDKVFNGIHVYGVNNTYKGRVRRALNFTKDVYLKALEIDADIYHFHDPELIYIGIKLKKKGKKVIYDIHEDVPRQIVSKYWIPKPLRKIISFVFEKYENKSVKKMDALVTATPYIMNRFIKHNSKVVNINNYPIMKELLYRQDSKSVIKKKAFTYIGGISEARGSVNMIKAISELDATLKLAGNFADNNEKIKLDELNSWEKVDFLGFIDRGKIKEILETSMAGLVILQPKPNFIDSLPIKMFEYMATGLPVIASNFPLWKNIVEGNNCGICVDPLNVDEITQAIQWVLKNPEKATEMGENGREAVRAKYNWESESEKLISLYKGLSL
ncbi:glycosyltransferase family 4 protein [Virgibacillus sp. YIM 98842]|uniref:glycosyltransferase family 4 protein n=1 Tax=Virgibacillus sp. YIM 98842 TaxID=2663533 RepID=UPI0013DC214D|nr:glycosyltransferase family 4 protein [Virgibacillus sp. YIM 98842]